MVAPDCFARVCRTLPVFAALLYRCTLTCQSAQWADMTLLKDEQNVCQATHTNCCKGFITKTKNSDVPGTHTSMLAHSAMVAPDCSKGAYLLHIGTYIVHLVQLSVQWQTMY